MSPTLPTWRVLHSHQDTARKNARQALLVIQERRRAQADADRALPLLADAGTGPAGRPRQRTRSTRRSSQTGSGDS